MEALQGRWRTSLMSDLAIKTCDLTKKYRDFTAVEQVSLNVPKGLIYGFLGPNGAGKTTMIRMLLGLLTPDRGKVEILGKDLFSHRLDIMRNVGAIVEHPIFYEYLTAYENLMFLSGISGQVDRAKIEEVLDIVGLLKVRDKKIAEFSFGMKQRLGIGQALLPDNSLIFLDEPINGLDPHGILDIRNLLRYLCEERGVTIFLSSHMLYEVRQTCDVVGIINEGRLIKEDSVENLVQGHDSIELLTPDDELFTALARENEWSFNKIDSFDDKSLYFIDEGKDRVPEITRQIAEAGIKIHKIGIHEKNLEDVFVQATTKPSSVSLADKAGAA